MIRACAEYLKLYEEHNKINTIYLNIRLPICFLLVLPFTIIYNDFHNCKENAQKFYVLTMNIL